MPGILPALLFYKRCRAGGVCLYPGDGVTADAEHHHSDVVHHARYVSQHTLRHCNLHRAKDRSWLRPWMEPDLGLKSEEPRE